MSVGDEIIIKDPAGKFKILRGGKFYDFTPPVKATSAKVEKKLVDQIIEKSGLRIAENLKARFADELEAYFKDVRDKFETKSALIRAVPSGGMGFTPEAADLVIGLVGKIKPKGERQDEKETAAATETKKTEVRPAIKNAVKTESRKPKIAEMPKGVAELVFSPADEAEISAKRDKLPKQVSGLKPAETAGLVDSVIGESGVNLDEIGRKKLENILLTHLKDIRDGFEMQDTLSGFFGSAGITLTSEQISKILAAAKKIIGGAEAKNKEEAVSTVEKALESERVMTGKANEEVLTKVKNKIDERWQQITKRAQIAPLDVPAAMIAPPAGMQAKISTIAPAKPAIVPEKIPLRPAGEIKPSAEIIKEIPSAIRGKVSPGEEPKPFQILKPATAPSRRPVVTVDDKRPRLEDVRYVPKLVGPLEELKEMTMVDFRRLDQNPEVASAKVQEKMRLLERESITKKIAGIKAWQESEVYKLYLEISRESMNQGASVSQVIASRISSGKPSLTEAEYQALVKLSRSLRY